jgi:hypothetical protein
MLFQQLEMLLFLRESWQLRSILPLISSLSCHAAKRKWVLQDLRVPGLYLLPSIAVGDLDFEVLQINPCFLGKSTRSWWYIKATWPGNLSHAEIHSSHPNPLAAAAPFLSQAGNPPLYRRPSPSDRTILTELAGSIPPELAGHLPPMLVLATCPQHAGARGARRPPPTGASADYHGVWYVSNVSIIFDAPCLFLHHLPTVSLHFVALLCIFWN